MRPDFWPVARALERQLRRAPAGGGAAVCVYHRGEKVVDLHGGARDVSGTPWTPDTLSVSFSTTKAVTGVALHRAATTRGTPRRGFGHYGFGGSGGYACPDRQLAVALVLNSGFGTPFGDMRTAEIGGAALRCANRLAAR